MQFNQAFAKELDEVLNRLIDITKQNKRIAQNWIDEEMTADIYMEIASEAVDSPDLRFTWLGKLLCLITHKRRKFGTVPRTKR